MKDHGRLEIKKGFCTSCRWAKELFTSNFKNYICMNPCFSKADPATGIPKHGKGFDAIVYRWCPYCETSYLEKWLGGCKPCQKKEQAITPDNPPFSTTINSLVNTTPFQGDKTLSTNHFSFFSCFTTLLVIPFFSLLFTDGAK